MKKTIDWRLICAGAIVVVLILCQVIFRQQQPGWADCITSLMEAGERQTTDFFTYYGFPWPTVATYTSGCFEARVTRLSNVDPLGVAVNLATLVALGGLPYWLTALWRRRKPEV
jgi:hypothetical protein